ncbi:MAG: formylglycine-generating enzyme family protein [Planctomycetota bacterium]
MFRTAMLVSLAGSLVTLTAAAQSGRSMMLLGPMVIGQTASIVMEHPPTIAGNQFAMAMCSPTYPGALPVSIPGAVEGVLRLDPLGYSVLGIGVLDASGRSPALVVAVPNDPLLVGASFDVQGADIDGSGFLALTDNDVEVTVAAPPPASLNMVAIAPGTFSMGSNTVGGVATPVHPVTITQPFWMGKYEVTQAEFQTLMGSNPSLHQGPSFPNSGNRPVEQVSWNQAVAYCDALTVQEAAAGRLAIGYEYRLPTEAEWEYCCRAGTTTEWHVGDSAGCADANFYSGGNCVPGPTWWGYQTSGVGSYPANAFGLHDLHGNVYEWCLDAWDALPNYPATAVSDPLVTFGGYRVIRGGSCSDYSFYSRSAHRNYSWHVDSFAFGYTLGFRVVCAPVR